MNQDGKDDEDAGECPQTSPVASRMRYHPHFQRCLKPGQKGFEAFLLFGEMAGHCSPIDTMFQRLLVHPVAAYACIHPADWKQRATFSVVTPMVC